MGKLSIKEVAIMAMSKEAIEYKKELEKNAEEIRNIVLKGVKQADNGQVKPMDEVFDRLEKKYGV